MLVSLSVIPSLWKPKKANSYHTFNHLILASGIGFPHFFRSPFISKNCFKNQAKIGKLMIAVGVSKINYDIILPLRANVRTIGLELDRDVETGDPSLRVIT